MKKAINAYIVKGTKPGWNYPTRERTTAFFHVEMTKKGCRSVFQTINPKTGKLNAPKKSTYCPIKLPCTIVQNGHFDVCGHLDFNGDEAINKGLLFMSDFYECFTIEQVKDISLTALAMSKVNAKAQVIYCGTQWEQLKPLVTHSIETLAQIAKTGENLFISASLDVSAIEALKVPDYNPFKISASY